MSLRPVPARWFEVLVMRDDLTAALDVLARSARVELQSHGETRAPLLTPESRELLEEFDALRRRYGHHWPAPRAHVPDERQEPHVMLELAMTRLRGWAAAARETVDRLEALLRQLEDLQLFSTLFQDATGPVPDLQDLAQAGPMLESSLYLLAADEWPQALPASVITQRLVTPDHTFLLAVGLPDDMVQLEQQLLMLKARPLQFPEGLPGAASEAADVIRDRTDDTDTQIEHMRHMLGELHEQHDIADAIADAEFVRWYVDNVPDLDATENFAWITGWTSDPDEQSLLRLLAASDVKGLLHVSEPPSEFDAPLILHNPRWLRPFEVFTGMLGVPAAGEADPTRIVAIASPLMFGYMFGDIGHGAVLFVAGLAFSRKYPALRLLIAGGAVSIVFGFLFGSVFTLENLFDPLWVHPMDQPIRIILVPMFGGAALLLIGMGLDALQAYWQRQGRFWWETGAGLMLCYLALLGSIWELRLLWVALLGGVWFIIGHAFISPTGRLVAMGSATAEFLETLLRLIVNTISFVRVGAFALAHAGLSLAVVGVAATPESLPAKLVVLIVGNIFIIGLEGLVVGIQTTRLVLFEFFVRFLRAEGRPFKPMVPAPSEPPAKHRRQQ